ATRPMSSAQSRWCGYTGLRLHKSSVSRTTSQRDFISCLSAPSTKKKRQPPSDDCRSVFIWQRISERRQTRIRRLVECLLQAGITVIDIAIVANLSVRIRPCGEIGDIDRNRLLHLDAALVLAEVFFKVGHRCSHDRSRHVTRAFQTDTA